jgi:hypothetical protein
VLALDVDSAAHLAIIAVSVALIATLLKKSVRAEFGGRGEKSRVSSGRE